MKTKYLNTVLILLIDLASIYISIVLTFYLREFFSNYISLTPLGHGITLYLAKWWMPLVIILSIVYHRGYGIIITAWDDFLVIIKSLAVSFLIVWVVLSLQKQSETVSRVIITFSFIYMLVVMFSLRNLIKYMLYKVVDCRQKANIYKDEKKCGSDSLKEIVNGEWYLGYKIIDNRHSNIIRTEVLFIPMELATDDLIKKLKPTTKDLIVISEMSGLSFMNTEIKTFMDKNIAFITTTNGLLSKHRVLLKRTFDFIIAVVGLIASCPFFLVIPILIKFDSPGNVFFIHKRCGKGLDEFPMIKFRTMRMDSEKMINSIISDNPNVLIELEERNKIKNDPRITRIGNFLRKTSLDELPQLFNVIRGHMSIVGPRPDTKEVISKYYQEYKEIYENIRPGLTGLWQVSGRSEIGYQKRIKLDYLYMLNWSLWIDIVIVIKTYRALLSKKGAY